MDVQVTLKNLHIYLSPLPKDVARRRCCAQAQNQQQYEKCLPNNSVFSRSARWNPSSPVCPSRPPRLYCHWQVVQTSDEHSRGTSGQHRDSIVILAIEVVENALGLRNQADPLVVAEAGVRKATRQYQRCILYRDLPQSLVN